MFHTTCEGPADGSDTSHSSSDSAPSNGPTRRPSFFSPQPMRAFFSSSPPHVAQERRPHALSRFASRETPAPHRPQTTSCLRPAWIPGAHNFRESPTDRALLDIDTTTTTTLLRELQAFGFRAAVARRHPKAGPGPGAAGRWPLEIVKPPIPGFLARAVQLSRLGPRAWRRAEARPAQRRGETTPALKATTTTIRRRRVGEEQE